MSLPSTEADVQIILEGQDNASVVIEDAAKRINRQYRTMRNEQRAVERQFEINNRQFVQTGRVLGSMGSIISRVRGVYNTFLLQQIRNEQTARNVRDAQKDLNDAIAQFGQRRTERGRRGCLQTFNTPRHIDRHHSSQNVRTMEDRRESSQ